MSDILTKIEAYKREEIANAKRAHPLASVEALAKSAPPPRGFVTLRGKCRTLTPPFREELHATLYEMRNHGCRQRGVLS